MKFFNSILFTVFAVAVIFLVGSSLVKLLPQKKAVDKEATELEVKIQNTEQINLELSEMMDFFKSDAYKEREARLRLNYIKPGEQAAIVYRSKEESAPKPDTESALDIFNKFFDWQKLKKWILRD